MIFSVESISMLVGFLLSLMIFSYLISDNFLFRIAMYLFVGVASGYAAAIIVRQVLWTRVMLSISGDILAAIALLISLTVLFKFSPRTAWIGNFAMAILVGVGAATVIGGGLIGTLLPQAQASMDAFAPLMGLRRFYEAPIMLAATVFTLASFHFTSSRAPDGTVKRNAIFEGIRSVGRVFIAITLGVLFAGVYVAALTAMIERLSSFVNFGKYVLNLLIGS